MAGFCQTKIFKAMKNFIIVNGPHERFQPVAMRFASQDTAEQTAVKFNQLNGATVHIPVTENEAREYASFYGIEIQEG